DRDSFDTVAMGTVAGGADGAPQRTASRSLGGAFRAALFGRRGDMPTGRETHGRSSAKAVSWRATGSIDTFVLAWLITGSTAWAGSIAGTEIFTKIVIYYLHERIWSYVRWGRR
ncbi:MAG TPA: DUF2061 domain-containing protein, partial [Pseudolabrys sp.]|nr:DUF2061 domain-containing protein [Pseudolabrys sp.]